MGGLSPELTGHLVELAALALVGFLLKRAINNLDDSLKDIKAQLTVLDQMDRAQGKDIVELKLQNTHLNNTVRRLEDRYDHIAGFLQSKGMRRSEPDKGDL